MKLKVCRYTEYGSKKESDISDKGSYIINIPPANVPTRKTFPSLGPLLLIFSPTTLLADSRCRHGPHWDTYSVLRGLYGVLYTGLPLPFELAHLPIFPRSSVPLLSSLLHYAVL